MEKLKENKMGTDSIFKLTVSMSIPAMIAMFIQAMYNIVDSFYVARIGENVLTAVSLAYPIQVLSAAVAIGTSVGINSLVSGCLGNEDREKANKISTHGIILGLFSYILFAIFGLFFSRLFVSSFTNFQQIIDMGTDYLVIINLFSFGVFIELNIEKSIQATGNTVYPMISQLIGAITNIILDPIFIFGFGFIPAMGIKGAAIATVIGEISAMLFILFIAKKKENIVSITFKNFKLDFSIIKEIYSVGFPSIIMQSISSIMVVLMNIILISFTETAVAFLGIYFKLQTFIFMPVFGLCQGIMPIMGYNFGAKNKKRLISTLKTGLLISTVIMTIGTIIFMIFPKEMLNIFNASNLMISIGVPALRTISLSFISAAFGITISTFFQAIGNGYYSLIISVSRQLLALIPVSYLLSKISLSAVWYAFPLSEIISLLACIILFIKTYKNVINNLENNNVI